MANLLTSHLQRVKKWRGLWPSPAPLLLPQSGYVFVVLLNRFVMDASPSLPPSFCFPFSPFSLFAESTFRVQVNEPDSLNLVGPADLMVSDDGLHLLSLPPGKTIQEEVHVIQRIL